MLIIPFTKIIQEKLEEAETEIHTLMTGSSSLEDLRHASKALGRAEAFLEVLKLITRLAKLEDLSHE